MDETERRERKRRIAIWIMVILAGMLLGAGLGVALSIPSLLRDADAPADAGEAVAP